MDNIKLMKNFVQSLQKHAEKNCTNTEIIDEFR